MFTIQKLNSISPKADEILKGYAFGENAPDAVILRSFSMHEWTMPETVLAVARAGAGVNNIPFADYAERGVCVFNTPGANANGVKELIILAMLLACRDVIGGNAWANTLVGDDVAKQVEKGKKAFAGIEIMGKTLCILGLGAIGRKLAVSANALGMNVVGYDPFLSDAARAEIPFVTVYADMGDAVKCADFVSLNMPYIKGSTHHLMNAELIAKAKDGAIIINCARGELVDNDAMKAALETGKIAKYVVDFPSQETVNVKNIICIPHLGASTEEAEDNCAVMAAEELKDYLEKGIIRNSVNMPAVSSDINLAHRYTAVSKGEVKFDGQAKLTAAEKFGVTYTIIDTDEDNAEGKISGNLIKVRKVY